MRFNFQSCRYCIFEAKVGLDFAFNKELQSDLSLMLYKKRVFLIDHFCNRSNAG